jgi:hypothetical protein
MDLTKFAQWLGSVARSIFPVIGRYNPEGN